MMLGDPERIKAEVLGQLNLVEELIVKLANRAGYLFGIMINN
jgi:hypothetical protein